MKPLSHILVPIDFSPWSKAAFDHAVSLAARTNATLDLLYVWPGNHDVACERFDDLDAKGPFVSSGRSAFAATLEGRELEALMRLARSFGLRVRGRLESGSPSRAILRVATDDHYDLIVMGTHGRTGMAHLLFGSVAEEIVRSAPCPVMTVRRVNGFEAEAAAGDHATD
jgi:nucleotide-binding universal stress UspA family protein